MPLSAVMVWNDAGCLRISAMVRAGGLFLGAGLELADLQIAGLALHQAHDAVAWSPGRARCRSPSGRAVLPLLELRAVAPRSCACRRAGPGVVGPVALAPLLHGAAQVPVQLAALAHVAPDVAVDGLVADAAATRSMPRYPAICSGLQRRRSSRHTRCSCPGRKRGWLRERRRLPLPVRSPSRPCSARPSGCALRRTSRQIVLRCRPRTRAICGLPNPCLRRAESLYLSSEVIWW